MTVIVQGTALKILARIMDGPPATTRDLSRFACCSQTNAIRHVYRLRHLGLITWQAGMARTIRPAVRFIPAEELP